MAAFGLVAALSEMLGAAALPCAECHPQETASFGRTGMGRSLTSSVKPAGATKFSVGGSEFVIKGRMQSVRRNGYVGSHEVAYAIGSGNHAIGYLVRKGPYLFQSPVSFYTQKEVWAVAPGYESNPRPDFNRPILAECLFCHAGDARLDGDSVNRYGDPPVREESITCDRCHGPGDRHAKAPSKSNIVNPTNLPPVERASVCEQCHLGGEARVRNPGRDWSSYVPGEVVEASFSTFVSGRFRVASHVEQLSLSNCATRSEGRLWCGTCHSPHQGTADVAAHYREKCQSCHSSNEHVRAKTECVSCHMQRRKAPDSGHSSFTDHWIRRRPAEAAAEESDGDLRPWRPVSEPLASRNLGLAYIAVGERELSTHKIQKGFELLWSVRDKYPDDPEVLASLGAAMFLKNRPKAAALLFEQAVAKRPGFAPYYQKLGVAWGAAGDKDRAIKILERAIQLDPSLEAAYHTLAGLKPPGKAKREALERYLEFMPESVVTREILRRLGVPPLEKAR